MAFKYIDRVKETSSTTGTVALSLGGAVSGFQTFASNYSDGDTFYYNVTDQSGSAWEVGLGTYTSTGNKLTRTTVLASSNSGSAVNFTSAALYCATSLAAAALPNQPGVLGLINISQSVTTVTHAASPYTILSTDYLILVDTTGGAVTLNLPSPAIKYRFRIKDSKGNFGTTQCTIARNGSETIDGLAASLILYANWGNYEISSDGTNWWKTSAACNLAYQTYGTSGGTWTAPAGVTQAIISGRGGSGGGGGGGAGGGGSTGAAAEGGGGGGPGGSCYTVTKLVTVVPNTAYTVTVGSGGSVGTAGTVTGASVSGSTGGSGGQAGNGGATSFGSLFSCPGGNGGGGGNGGALAATGSGGFAGESVGYFGITGAAGGVTNAQGGNTTQPFTFSPWAADSASSNGTGGAAGGASGGGGGGAGGIPMAGDTTPANGVTAGAGGASGANGSAGTAVNATSSGVGGMGGSGGGGGGLKAATGSTGGAGQAGGIGNAGYLTISWQE